MLIADDDHRRAAQKPPAAGGAAIHHPAVCGERTQGRVGRLAHRRADAVGTDQQIGFDRAIGGRAGAAAVGDLHAHTRRHRHKSAHTLAGTHHRLAHSRHHRIEEDLLKPPAMNRVLRPTVACAQTARLGPDQLAAPVVIRQLGGRDAVMCQRLAQTEFGQLADRMRRQVHAHADLADLSRSFEDLHLMQTRRMQAECGSQPADAATGDQNAHVTGNSTIASPCATSSSR